MAYYDDRYYPPRDRYSQGYHDSRVSRPRDSTDSFNDYGYEYGYGAPPQSRHRRHHSAGDRRSYYDDEDDGYRPRHRRRHHDERRDRRRYDSPSPVSSPSRPRRRKSFSEQALGALGLGSAASGATSSRHYDSRDSRDGRGRSSGRHRRSYSSPSRSRSRGRRHGRGKSEQRMAQAVQAALAAGAIEAFRLRKEPGEWAGNKGKRVLTAAVTAGGTDGLLDKDPGKHQKRHVIESALAGLATDRFINGSRSRSRSRPNKHGGRSSSSGAKKAAGTALLAAAGKEAYKRYKSRSRPRGRSSSRDSRDSYDGSPEPRRTKKRSKSVTDYINKGIAALGLNEDDKERSQGRSRRYDDYSDDDRDSDPSSRRHRSSRHGRHYRDVGRPLSTSDSTNYPYYYSKSTTRSGAKGDEGHGPYHHLRHIPSSSRDLHNHNSDTNDSTTDEEKTKTKKLNRDTLLATGLATVATIHAAHSVYGSVEKRRHRRELVQEGEMSPEEARKRRIKANLGDAARVGVAALGIQSAVSEWKEVDEKRRERNDFRRECSERRNSERRQRRARSHDPGTYRRKVFVPDEIEAACSPHQAACSPERPMIAY